MQPSHNSVPVDDPVIGPFDDHNHRSCSDTVIASIATLRWSHLATLMKFSGEKWCVAEEF